jgi:Rad3-related DNA helicase
MLGYPDLLALSIKGRANYLCQRRTQLGARRGAASSGSIRATSSPTPRSRRARGCARTARSGRCPGALFARFPALRDLRRRAVAPRAETCTREQCAAEPACPLGRRPRGARARAARGGQPRSAAALAARLPELHPRDRRRGARARGRRRRGLRHRAAAPRRCSSGSTSCSAARRGARRRCSRRAPGGDPAHRARRARRGAARARARARAARERVRRGAAARVCTADPARGAAIASRAAARLDDLAQLASDLDAERGVEDALSEQIGRGVGELRDAATALRAAFTEDDRVVAAFEGLVEPFDRWRMALRQVSPAASFHGHLLDKLEAFACVSASLFVGGDPFAALGELEVETREAPSWRASFESPFPYATHMRAVALADLGDPVELTTAVLADLARALGGRTLGLFTSLRRMREVQERLAVALRPDGIEVWMPRRATDDPGALVDRFRRARGGGVLLGSRTFWQGIDVPAPRSRRS